MNGWSMLIFFVVAVLCVHAGYSSVRLLKCGQSHARGEIAILVTSLLCFIMAAALAFMHML